MGTVASLQPKPSKLAGASGMLGRTMHVKMFENPGECVFCYAQMVHGDRTVQLACH